MPWLFPLEASEEEDFDLVVTAFSFSSASVCCLFAFFSSSDSGSAGSKKLLLLLLLFFPSAGYVEKLASGAGLVP